MALKEWKQPFIGGVKKGTRGGSTPEDLETMFQLLYLQFTQPRDDPTAFAAAAAQTRALLVTRWRARTSFSTGRSTPRLAVTIRVCDPRRRGPYGASPSAQKCCE
jgi:hypothetical protein